MPVHKALYFFDGIDEANVTMYLVQKHEYVGLSEVKTYEKVIESPTLYHTCSPSKEFVKSHICLTLIPLNIHN